jgi:hypothetical protein
MSVPHYTTAIVLQQSPTPVYHDAVLMTRPIPALKEGDVLVKMTAASFNHREVSFSNDSPRQVTKRYHVDSYGFGKECTQGSLSEVHWELMAQVSIQLMTNHISTRGVGIVIASSDPNDTLLHKRVFLTPSRGWTKDPDGPESEYV